MKVNILQVEQAVFHRFSWWSNWVDVAVFDWASQPYLLQMRVNRINRKKFSAISISGKYIYHPVRCEAIGDLTSMATESKPDRSD